MTANVTAVDSNILIDLMSDDEVLREQAVASLRSAHSNGIVVICDVVYAEVCVAFDTQEACDQFLARFQIRVESLFARSSFLASRSWKSYLGGGGKRLRILPDFLIAGHAVHQADQLLTRDRGFYRSHFSKLRVIDPTRYL